jgi:hypothetical protein
MRPEFRTDSRALQPKLSIIGRSWSVSNGCLGARQKVAMAFQECLARGSEAAKRMAARLSALWPSPHSRRFGWRMRELVDAGMLQ